jgi:hypothetical protein
VLAWLVPIALLAALAMAAVTVPEMRCLIERLAGSIHQALSGQAKDHGLRQQC